MRRITILMLCAFAVAICGHALELAENPFTKFQSLMFSKIDIDQNPLLQTLKKLNLSANSDSETVLAELKRCREAGGEDNLATLSNLIALSDSGADCLQGEGRIALMVLSSINDTRVVNPESVQGMEHAPAIRRYIEKYAPAKLDSCVPKMKDGLERRIDEHATCLREMEDCIRMALSVSRTAPDMYFYDAMRRLSGKNFKRILDEKANDPEQKANEPDGQCVRMSMNALEPLVEIMMTSAFNGGKEYIGDDFKLRKYEELLRIYVEIMVENLSKL